MALFACVLMASCGILTEHPDTPGALPGQFGPAPLRVMAPVYGPLPPPYESVCRSRTLRRRGFVTHRNFVSSGALLDADLLITAAHNYASYGPWSVVVDRSVECGAGVAAPGSMWWRLGGGFDRITQIRNSPETRGSDWAHDYALIWLGRSAPRRSSFRMRLPNEELIDRDSIVYVAGYPAEGATEGSVMMHGRAKVDSIASSVIYYRLDSERGLSGAPVWVNSGNDFVIVGVHVADGRAHHFEGQSLANISQWRTAFHTAR